MTSCMPAERPVFRFCAADSFRGGTHSPISYRICQSGEKNTAANPVFENKIRKILTTRYAGLTTL